MNKTEHPRKALGKGMSALVPTRALPSAASEPVPERPESALTIPIDSIDPNPLQPRRTFEQERLEELGQSILANGIIQPLVVRKIGDRYQLVAGERRWRAAKLVGINEIPAVIRDIPDDRLLEITLIENIQREDLNPIETATALHRMSIELSLTPDEVGRRTGKDRTTITNFTRLLQLPTDLQQLVADRAVARGWSVRETERVSQKLLAGREAKHVEDVEQDPNVRAAIQEMQRVLGTRVRIIEGARKKGRIEIEYYSQEDLDRIYTAIVGDA